MLIVVICTLWRLLVGGSVWLWECNRQTVKHLLSLSFCACVLHVLLESMHTLVIICYYIYVCVYNMLCYVNVILFLPVLFDMDVCMPRCISVCPDFC